MLSYPYYAFTHFQRHSHRKLGTSRAMPFIMLYYHKQHLVLKSYSATALQLNKKFHNILFYIVIVREQGTVGGSGRIFCRALSIFLNQFPVPVVCCSWANTIICPKYFCDALFCCFRNILLFQNCRSRKGMVVATIVSYPERERSYIRSKIGENSKAFKQSDRL